MKSIVRIFVPAVVALGFAGQAGAGELLVETEYPGPTPTMSSTNVASSSGSEPYLIQSNSEGPRVNPVYESRTATASRSAPAIRAEATIAVPYGPAMNA
ncbi:MAG TPA: hypothetical protein VGE10_03755 [Zeimonas sp.]